MQRIVFYDQIIANSWVILLSFYESLRVNISRVNKMQDRGASVQVKRDTAVTEISI